VRRFAALVLAVVASAGAAGCSSDDGTADGTATVDPLGLGAEAVGTCLKFDEAVGAEVTELPVIDCELPHSHEIYAIEKHPADVYPGFEQLESFAQLECLAAFEPYVRNNPFDSTLFYSWLVPTLDGWNDEDDREVLCVLGDNDGAPLVGSKKGTGA
jgi:hypothetical protein